MDSAEIEVSKNSGVASIAIRRELTFTPQPGDRDLHYIIEDPIRSKFYRVGSAEYEFISRLDGRRSINDVLDEVARDCPEQSILRPDAAAICKWLVDAELAQVTANSPAEQSAVARQSPTVAGGWNRLNPMFIRVPLVHPDRFFNNIVSWTVWIFAPWMFVVWAVAIFTAGYQVTQQWDRFFHSSRGILAPSNWLWLAACWFVLKVVHEMAHGIVCKKYGGSVREAGAILILFTPLAYVDVTSSWRCRSRWPRIHTAAAGIYIELLIAAIAALVWVRTEPGVLNHLCFNVIAMAGLTTLLFNANPLMRFDGYYILSDLLEIPNLYTSGQQYLRYFGRRYILGVVANLPIWPRGKGGIIRVYGVAALAWRVTVCASLAIAAAALFHGAGIVLAIMAVATWIGVPVVRFIKYLLKSSSVDRPNWTQFALVSGTSLLLAAVVLFVLPWPGAVCAPAVVDYAPLSVVRADSPGFVTEVLVQSGDRVEQGRALVTLRNNELVAERNDLELAIAQSKLKSRAHQQKKEIAAHQSELEHRQSLLKKKREIESQIEALTIRAPSSGIVIGRNLDAMLGKYVDLGDEVLSIGNDEKKELQVAISQDNLDHFAAATGQSVDIRIRDVGGFQSTLMKVSPRASLQPPHPALSAQAGGPLAVKPANVESGQQNSAEHYELLAPSFKGQVSLASAVSQRVNAGQIATISLRPHDEAIGPHLYHLVARWFRDKFEMHVKSAR